MSIRARTSGPIAMLRRFSQNLQRVAGGDVCAETAEIVGDAAGEEIVDALGPHRRTGASADAMLVQTSAKGVRVVAAYYLKFHPSWWRFGEKVLPPEYATLAVETFKQRVRVALGDG